MEILWLQHLGKSSVIDSDSIFSPVLRVGTEGVCCS